MLHRVSRFSWIPLLLAFWPTFSNAEDSLTLEQAVQEARERSPDYLKTVAEADAASARKIEALSGHLPKLSASGGYLTNHRFLLFPIGGAAIEAPNPISFLSFDASITVFDGLQTIRSFQAARLTSEAAHHEVEHAELKVDNVVKLKFYQALSAQMLADVADQNVKTLQDHLTKTKALLSGGATTKLDALRVDVQLSEAMPDQIQAHDNVIISRRALAEAMGRDDDERPLKGVLPKPEAQRVPADLKLEVLKRSDLLAAQERADAAASFNKGSYGNWSPRVNVQGQYQVYNNLNNSLNTSYFQNAYTLGLYFSWSLLDAANISRVSESSARRTIAEKTAQQALQKAPVDFELWKRRFFSNVALYQARTHAIESATESVRLARISYEAGSRTSTEVLDAELDLFRARAGVVRAQVDSAEALLNLEMALGHHL